MNLRRCGLLCLTLLLLGSGIGWADAIDDFLGQRSYFGDDRIRLADQLIRDNPNDPRLLRLRFYRTGISGSASGPDFQRGLIKELIEIAVAAENKRDYDLAFDARSRVGEIQYHVLHDNQRAYSTYKSLERHPAVLQDSVESDYKRMTVYLGVAASAYFCYVASPTGSGSADLKKDMERYSRQVMDYPYLELMYEDPLYHKFYDLYTRAGNIYLNAVKDDLAKLRMVQVPPSQEVLHDAWRTMIEQASANQTSANQTDEAHKPAAKTRIQNVGHSFQPAVRAPAATSVAAVPRANTRPSAQLDASLPTASRHASAKTTGIPWLRMAVKIFIGLDGMLIFFLIWRRYRKQWRMH